MADKSTKDKFKNAVKGYVKSGVDAVKSTKLFRAAENTAKDAKQKAATNKAVSIAMDSKYEGKINPPKEMLLRVAQFKRNLWAANAVEWVLRLAAEITRLRR